MSSSRAAVTILRKELLEALRDRKTLVIMVVLPLLLYPLVFIGFSQATLAQQDRMAREELVLGIGGGPAPAALLGALEAVPSSRLVELQDVDAAVRQGRVFAALDVDPAARALVASGDQGEVRIVYDGSSDRSREAERRLREVVSSYVEQVRRGRLEDAGLRPEFVDPVALDVINVAPPARQGGWLLGQILPMLVSFLMIGAAFYPAVDLTAGEKERGTLQTLLTAPISPLSIVAGKFGAVVVLALLTGLINLLAVALVAVSIPLPDEIAAEVSFAVAPGVVLLVLACLVCLGMMFGAVMMAVAVTARSFKDAQNYLTPLYLLCVFPLMVASLPGVQLTPATAAIPVVNLALAMKQLLLGTWSGSLLLVVFLSSTTWTGLGLVLAARVFSMETVLLGDEGLTALWRRRPPQERTGDRAVPTLGEAVTLLAIVLLVLFYGSLAIADAPVLVLVHTTQWGFILAPALALVAALGLSPIETFALRRPPARAVLTAVACGLGTWYVALQAMEAAAGDWLPVPSPQLEAFSEALVSLGSQPSTAILLFLGAAVAPAICEEALFRGVVLQSLRRRLSASVAVPLSALVFALYHLNLHQVPTTLVVGLLLGALTVTSRSIWPAVLLHLLHNGLALTAQLYVPPAWLDHPAAMALLVALIGGLVLLRAAWRDMRPAGPDAPVTT